MLGKTISHYKVLEKIGQGGMGEVYRATDTKLNRDVALKILPEQFASDSQRMGRFQREAEVLASLDHPNIGQIYGIEDAGQTKALVLQLIEGPTLAAIIHKFGVSVDFLRKFRAESVFRCDYKASKSRIEMKPVAFLLSRRDVALNPRTWRIRATTRLRTATA